MITKINLNKPFCVLLSCALIVLSCQNVLASKLPDRFLHLSPCPKGLKHAKAINIKNKFVSWQVGLVTDVGIQFRRNGQRKI